MKAALSASAERALDASPVGVTDDARSGAGCRDGSVSMAGRYLGEPSAGARAQMRVLLNPRGQACRRVGQRAAEPTGSMRSCWRARPRARPAARLAAQHRAAAAASRSAPAGITDRLRQACRTSQRCGSPAAEDCRAGQAIAQAAAAVPGWRSGVAAHTSVPGLCSAQPRRWRSLGAFGQRLADTGGLHRAGRADGPGNCRGRRYLSKRGPARLRQLLFNAAMSAAHLELARAVRARTRHPSSGPDARASSSRRLQPVQNRRLLLGAASAIPTEPPGRTVCVRIPQLTRVVCCAASRAWPACGCRARPAAGSAKDLRRHHRIAHRGVPASTLTPRRSAIASSRCDSCCGCTTADSSSVSSTGWSKTTPVERCLS